MLTPNHRTYSLKTPFRTHYRRATCAEVECPPYVRGWQSTFNVSEPLGQEQAQYVMYASGRQFTFTQEGMMVTFTFPPGQQCFGEEHWVPLERDPFMRVIIPGELNRTHTNADDWVDDFATHLDTLRGQENG